MSTYRSLWLTACGLCAGPGLVVASTWPTTSVVAILPTCAFLIGAATVHYNLARIDCDAPSPLSLALANVARNVAVGSVVAVAFLGLGAALGLWVLAVLALLAASSPAAVRSCHGWLARVESTGDDHGGPRIVPSPAKSPAPAGTGLRSLDDTELCQTWAASYRALRATSSPALMARIVTARQTYLDELARRNPEGLTAWLSSGTATPEDATPVFSPSDRGSGTRVDWDQLIPGQDEA